MTDHGFSVDIDAIRQRARRDMDAEGAVTGTYGVSPQAVIGLLNNVLATEIVCWMRYSSHANSATGIVRGPVSGEFSEHAQEEMNHAMMAAERIGQLGGKPDFTPKTLASLTRTTSGSATDTDLAGVLRENLVAERIVISTYKEIIRWLGNRDVITRRMLESILAEEENYADAILQLLGNLDGRRTRVRKA